MAFIVYCIVLFFIFIIYKIIAFIIINTYKSAKELDSLIETQMKYNMIDKKLKKSQIIERKEIERKQKIQKAIEKENESNYQHERNIAYHLLDKINVLKFKYPYADVNLFDEYRDSYYDMTLYQLDKLEERIKQNHLQNKNKSINTIEKTNYTLKDIENLSPLEIKKEYPIIMALYKNGSDYILYVVNELTKAQQLYQTKQYFIMLDLCNNMLNTIYELKEQKISVSALDIDKIIKDNNINDIHKMREQQIINRMNGK